MRRTNKSHGWDLLDAELVRAIATFLPQVPITPQGVWHLAASNKFNHTHLVDWLRCFKRQVEETRSFCDKTMLSKDSLSRRDLHVLNKRLDLGQEYELCAFIADGAFGRLHTVEFQNSVVYGEPFSKLFANHGFASDLQHLSLLKTTMHTESFASFADAVCSLRQLRALHFYDNDEGDMQMLSLSEAVESARANPRGVLPSLTELHLVRNKVDDEGIIAFTKAVWPTPQNPAGPVPNLTTLILKNNHISDNGILAFCHAIRPNSAGGLRSLQFLDFSNNAITDKGVATFSDAMTDGALGLLKTLCMSGNCIHDDGFKCLASSAVHGAMRCLEVLDMQFNHICDDGIVFFANVVRPTATNRIGLLSALTCLKLNHNLIGNIGMKALSSSIVQGSLPRIRNLCLICNLGDHRLVHAAMTARMR